MLNQGMALKKVLGERNIGNSMKCTKCPLKEKKVYFKKKNRTMRGHILGGGYQPLGRSRGIMVDPTENEHARCIIPSEAKGHRPIIQRNKLQTKLRKLNAANAYLQVQDLGSNAQLMQSRISLFNKIRAGKV